MALITKSLRILRDPKAYATPQKHTVAAITYPAISNKMTCMPIAVATIAIVFQLSGEYGSPGSSPSGTPVRPLKTSTINPKPTSDAKAATMYGKVCGLTIELSCGISIPAVSQATKIPSKKKELANASSPFPCLESLLRIKLDSKTLHYLIDFWDVLLEESLELSPCFELVVPVVLLELFLP